MFDQCPEAVCLRRIETFERRPLGGRVLAGRQVDRFLDPLAGVGIQPIEPANRLSPDQAALDHVRDHRDLSANSVIGVVFGQCRRQVAVDQRQQVETDQVQQSEHAGLGNAQRAAHHAVGFFDGQAAVDGLHDGALDPERADPVGDEARRIVADDDALAETAIAEVAHSLHHLGPSAGSGDQLEQAHVARRVKEMGDHEVARERRRQALGEASRRQGRGVR